MSKSSCFSGAEFRLLGEFFEVEDATDIILILRRLSKISPSRFLIKFFFAEIKYGVHRSNGNICVRVVLFFFCGNLDLRKCKFLT